MKLYPASWTFFGVKFREWLSTFLTLLLRGGGNFPDFCIYLFSNWFELLIAEFLDAFFRNFPKPGKRVEMSFDVLFDVHVFEDLPQ